MHGQGYLISNCTPCYQNKSTKAESWMSKRKSNKKSKKQLMFLEPIDKSMSVDEIYFKLIEIFKKKGIKIYHDKKDVNWKITSIGVTFLKS